MTAGARKALGTHASIGAASFHSEGRDQPGAPPTPATAPSHRTPHPPLLRDQATPARPAASPRALPAGRRPPAACAGPPYAARRRVTGSPPGPHAVFARASLLAASWALRRRGRGTAAALPGTATRRHGHAPAARPTEAAGGPELPVLGKRLAGPRAMAWFDGGGERRRLPTIPAPQRKAGPGRLGRARHARADRARSLQRWSRRCTTRLVGVWSRHKSAEE